MKNEELRMLNEEGDDPGRGRGRNVKPACRQAGVKYKSEHRIAKASVSRVIDLKGSRV